MLRFPPRKCEGANWNRAWIFHENGKSAISWPQVIKRKRGLPLVSDDDLIYYQKTPMIFETNFFWWNSGVWLSQRRYPLTCSNTRSLTISDPRYYWDALLNGCKKDNFCIYLSNDKKDKNLFCPLLFQYSVG